ncbi:ferritin family protein [Wukongibacter baidiensis]|uniref:ferritin family protein n=1 Tax=Wukongibacter baidiensis TaxID=1723361 RepID=UPI003D7F4BDA
MSEIKCLICCMDINPKSYSLNNYSFLEKNREERIINCPFCGVGKIYLDDENDIYMVDNKSLDEESLKVLDHAMKLEVFNGEFYEEASRLAEDEKLKETFKDLSRIEFMHARIHKRLGGFEKLPKLHKPDYTRHNTDGLLLIEASHREEHAILFYEKNSGKVSSDVIKQVFSALTDVEKQHEIITKRDLIKKSN